MGSKITLDLIETPPWKLNWGKPTELPCSYEHASGNSHN